MEKQFDYVARQYPLQPSLYSQADGLIEYLLRETRNASQKYFRGEWYANCKVYAILVFGQPTAKPTWQHCINLPLTKKIILTIKVILKLTLILKTPLILTRKEKQKKKKRMTSRQVDRWKQVFADHFPNSSKAPSSCIHWYSMHDGEIRHVFVRVYQCVWNVKLLLSC